MTDSENNKTLREVRPSTIVSALNINTTLMQSRPCFQNVEASNGIPSLVIMVGRQIGQRYILKDDVMVLGRDETVKIFIDDPGVSRKHACIRSKNNATSFTIEDMGSTNGTFVNQERISVAELQIGDKIYLGDTILKFSLEDSWDSQFQDQLEKLLQIDDLTGLLIKRCFDSELEIAMARCQLERMPLSLMMMDMDGLKQVNDQHGHLTGAHTIAQVGKIIGAQVRDIGLATRFGGDEFMVMLPKWGLGAAVEVAEHICETIHSTVIFYNDIQVNVTISIGVTSMQSDQTMEDLIYKADNALYKAKRNGRNRVEIVK